MTDTITINGKIKKKLKFFNISKFDTHIDDIFNGNLQIKSLFTSYDHNLELTADFNGVKYKMITYFGSRSKDNTMPRSTEFYFERADIKPDCRTGGIALTRDIAGVYTISSVDCDGRKKEINPAPRLEVSANAENAIKTILTDYI